MDILNVIKIGLFVPFFLTLLVTAIIYLIDGYKKDFGKSLVSFTATIISTLISVLLAKLCGWGTAKFVTPVLIKKLAEASEELGSVISLASGFIQGAIDVAMSFMFFAIFFSISLAVFKSLGKKINWKKLDKLNTGKTSTRIAGMGIRGIDAILVTIMLLLPVYGSIATIAPPAASLIDVFNSFDSVSSPENEYPSTMGDFENSFPSGDEFLTDENGNVISMNDFDQTIIMAKTITPLTHKINVTPSPSPETEEADISQIMETVANHPVLAPYKYGPGSWVFSGLSNVSLNGNTIDITTAVNSIEKILDLVQEYIIALQEEDTDEAIEIMEELIDYTRNDVINQKWSYDLVMALVGELDNIVDIYADELSSDVDIKELYDQLRPLLDMTFEEYTHNAEGLLDFASWFVETYGEYINKPLSDEDEQKIMEEGFNQAGELLNHSDQAIILKRIILQMQAQKMFDVLPDKNDPAYIEYYKTRKGLPNSGAEFVDEYFGDGIVPKDERAKEAAIMLYLIDSPDALGTAEAFARHPLFGADAVTESTDKYLYTSAYNEFMYPPITLNDDADRVFTTLDKILACYEDIEYDKPLSFKDVAIQYLIQEMGTDDTYGYTTIVDENGSVATIMQDSKGTLYVISEELAEGLDKEKPLTNDFIKKHNLKKFEEYISQEAEGYISENQVQINPDSGNVVIQGPATVVQVS